MKIAFKTLSYGFYAELNDIPIAAEIGRFLPLESRIEIEDGNICVPFSVVNINIAGAANINQRDVLWCPQKKCLSIYIRPESWDSSKDTDFYKNCPVIGKTLASIEELRQLCAEDEVNISVVEELKAFNRILSQGDIDTLVSQLLNRAG